MPRTSPPPLRHADTRPDLPAKVSLCVRNQTPVDFFQKWGFLVVEDALTASQIAQLGTPFATFPRQIPVAFLRFGRYNVEIDRGRARQRLRSDEGVRCFNLLSSNSPLIFCVFDEKY